MNKIVQCWRVVIFTFLVILGSSHITISQNRSPFPDDVERVLFLGNSITYAGTYISDIETYFITQFLDEQFEFINVGVSSETVSGLSEPEYAEGKFTRPDLHERLHRVLDQTKPDVVFACYGMNDGIYLPFDKKRFQAYKDGMTWLHNELQINGVKRIIFITPTVHDDKDKGLKGYNKVLDKYSDWLLSQRKKAKWEVIDVHYPMKKYLEKNRKKDKDFRLAKDGIHPEDLGHWLMAKSILTYLGEKEVEDIPDMKTYAKSVTNGEDIYELVVERQSLMRDAWLTSTKHTHPKLKAGIPLKEAREKYDKIGIRIEEMLTGNAAKPIRISCVGNSITEGKGVTRRDKNSYPALLQELLGEGYRVINFGSSGKTVINVESNAYTKTSKYQKALESRPNIVTIKLGTNDSRMPFREMIQDSFVVNYKNLIRSFRELPSQPRIMLLLPVTSYITAEDRHADKIISSQIIPRIRQVAFEEKLEMVDLHSITADNSAIFPDSLHPNEEGMSIIAHRLEEAILSEPIGNFDVFESIKVPYKISSFYGYDCADFNFDGRKAKVVKPRVLAKGSPWVWRARFWNVEPQADIALLDRGFHIVYCDVSELYGNDEAMEVWDDFYNLLTSVGLSKKAVLEGFSRGGFYAYVWAIQNPDKVACVYADAPVLDIRSWPGGKGKSKGNMEEWRKFMQSYGYNNEVDVLKFTNNPINNVANIVKGGYPMLHVVGSVDMVVPVDENTALFEQEVKRLGGDITVIYKRNVGHHPHSLTNPQPIVDFILKAVNQ